MSIPVHGHDDIQLTDHYVTQDGVAVVVFTDTDLDTAQDAGRWLSARGTVPVRR